MRRSCGILMPISSLPSKYGIGTLGKDAYEFADFLHDAGQSVWQLLPMGPTGYGDSPYSSFSSFAGNPYFIDPQLLEESGLLPAGSADGFFWGDDPQNVDYGTIYENRFRLLAPACAALWEEKEAELRAFEAENAGWLPDYALFMAIKRRFHMVSWTLWPDEGLRLRRPEALERCKYELRDDIRFFTALQYLFFEQLKALRRYVGQLGIRLVGDLPIYAAPDSADVWAAPEYFRLDADNRPTQVSGVPPDYFSADGQLWGNPIYDWDRLKMDGYGWWIRRIEGAARLYDVIRIDHFRGFESYWSVPYGSQNARVGQWEKGPGMDFVGVLRDRFRSVSFIAEDLGFLTEGVRELQRESGFPGMKILQFAFDPYSPSDYLPHVYSPNCVCYTGTHDNETLPQWLSSTGAEYRDYARRYMGLNAEEGELWGIIRGGMASVAELFVAQMQDYLELGAPARMNVPGTPQGNWRWRMLPGATTKELAARLKAMSVMYGRA